MPSRLIDKLIANNALSALERQSLTCAHVVNADNVAKYVDEILTIKFSNPLDELRALPRLTPPHPSMFIQYETLIKSPFEFGALVSSVQLNDEIDRWKVTSVFFSSSYSVHPWLGEYTLYLDRDGLMSHRGYDPDRGIGMQISSWYRRAIESSEELDHAFMYTINFACRVALWTLAFMNTKNVIMEAVEPNASENKRRAKHGKPPLMRYHVLKIRPIGREASEPQGGTHASPALHIRRGHFKTYTEAAPLFGKYTGTFWVDQHIAGKKSNHVVVKDYEVVP